MFDEYRTCKKCGYNGYMIRWIKTDISPHLTALLLLLLGVVPGIIYMIVNWYKLKCPECGTIRK